MDNSNIQTIIDDSKIDRTVIDQVIDETIASKEPGRFVFVGQLRPYTNFFGSRTEANQANLGSVGGVQRGFISNNALTQAIRQLMPEFISSDNEDVNIWDYPRGRSELAKAIFEDISAVAPELPIRIRLHLTAAILFRGVSKSKLSSKDLDKKFCSVQQAVDKQIAGNTLTADEEQLVLNPTSTIPELETLLALSVWEVNSVCRLASGGEGLKKRNTLLTEMSAKQLHDEVEHILLSSKPGIAAACFGRMTADLPNASVVGGTSVNMAITTTAAQTKTSLFGAFGDTAYERDHAGAHFLAQKELNTGVFLEYFVHSIPQLRENLSYISDQLFERFVAKLILCIAMSTPNGGQRAHATRSPVEAMFAVVTRLAPRTFESAFLKPTPNATEEGDMVASTRQMIVHISDYQTMFSTGADADVVFLATPSIRQAIGTFPSNWTVVDGIDQFTDKINSLTGVKS